MNLRKRYQSFDVQEGTQTLRAELTLQKRLLTTWKRRGHSDFMASHFCLVGGGMKKRESMGCRNGWLILALFKMGPNGKRLWSPFRLEDQDREMGTGWEGEWKWGWDWQRMGEQVMHGPVLLLGGILRFHYLPPVFSGLTKIFRWN